MENKRGKKLLLLLLFAAWCAVLLLRQICNGELLADAPRTRQEHVIRFDELPGAKIIGKAVEVRHIFEWAKKGTDNEEE